MDTKAVRILMKAFWSSKGWKSRADISEKDKEYLIQCGLWYPPQQTDHDSSGKELVSFVRKVDRKILAGNFLASLSTRKVYLRSALGSYAVHLHFHEHPFQGEGYCLVCSWYRKPRDEDWNVYRFEQLKWGGVRHDSVGYARFDLMTSMTFRETPTAEDRECFRKVIETIGHLTPKATVSEAERAIAALVPSNKSERKVVLQILGYCGILRPMERISFFEKYVELRDRDLPSCRNDWAYPVCWWRGKEGINQEALEFYFGDYL